MAHGAVVDVHKGQNGHVTSLNPCLLMVNVESVAWQNDLPAAVTIIAITLSKKLFDDGSLKVPVGAIKAHAKL